MSSELLLIVPFVVLLLSIAVFPLILPGFWHKNYPRISVGLGLIILLYYLFVEPDTAQLLHTFSEYISFIALLFSLFVVSGGIFIKVKGKATPLKNVLILFLGAVIANLFGTAGASMLLIRPFIESNKYRMHPYHIVFFIFIVGNIGGSLSPVGDPPLLLGYLKGVPFFWVMERLFVVWAGTVFILILLFYIIDSYYYHRIDEKVQDEIEYSGEKINVHGLVNLIPLAMIIGSVFITKPVFVREIIMLSAAFLSLKITKKEIHKRNHFNYEPIKEVALLFLGIFLTMIPALRYISVNAHLFGLDNTGNVFWTGGVLTSFLDNAPTYLNILSGTMGAFNLSINNPLEVAKFSYEYPLYLKAVSVACVYFGAMTYIGNAPNFMIKTFAEHKGVKVPGFFEYMYKYSLVILLPLFVLVWLFFYR
ncbi:MAG: sodium:proton antiporter [Ignavibacteria bacterium]|nr:sodium:proton antiporter [Ignavibacteria bacterium]